MSDSTQKENKLAVGSIIAVLLGGPWLEIIADLWKIGKKLWRGLADEGMYEVLEHEGTLELKDAKGKLALVRKRQKVRYRQNNILAYQDSAWGDGEIFINYRCSPGREADRYKIGSKTQILISLRDVKKKGDKDEFNIEWEHRNGFIRKVEQWGSEASHRTKHLKLNVIFPKSRPPLQVSLVMDQPVQTVVLDKDVIRKLPDGRWIVSWEKSDPRLFRQYSLRWEW
ncbi:MAG: hypothetical protein CL608_04565 [Anaerolineaceae bacterium]|nr:hypothetical protein [Anaerolineaceae bacterium]